MPIAKLDQLDLHYESQGSGEPLVLIAGYACDHTFWDGVLPTLSDHFEVITFDNRASGRTRDDGKPFSIETMAHDAARLIDHLSLCRPVVVGQSMGGAIVQAMLQRHADICGPCVVMNTTAVFSKASCMALDGLLALRQVDTDLDLLIDAVLPWLFGSEWLSVPANVQGFKKSLMENPVPQSVTDQARQLAAIKSFDARALGQRQDYPMLVISATEDVLTPVREGAALAERLGARFIDIPGGHASPVEQPEYLARVLLDFLARG